MVAVEVLRLSRTDATILGFMVDFSTGTAPAALALHRRMMQKRNPRGFGM